jgi:hypothetical protein
VRTRLLATALLVLLPITACGDDDDDDASGGGGSGGGGTELPDGATPGGAEGDLFVEVAFVGGLVPQEFAFRSVPQTVIYGDGTVIASGVTTLEFPGPAVAPLVQGRLDEDTLGELLEGAARAGMVGGKPAVGDQSAIPIADAASTRVTVVIDGDSQTVEAYALDIGDVGPTRLTDEQVAAREELAAFVDAVNEAGFAASDPYVPDRYRVLASEPVDGVGGDLPPNELLWPEGLPGPVVGECVAIEGDDAAALSEALADATEITRWIVGDSPVALAVRPVLPHEPGC